MVLFIGILSSRAHLILPLALIGFFGVAYSLVLYATTQHGRPNAGARAISQLTALESTVFFLHLALMYLPVTVVLSLFETF